MNTQAKIIASRYMSKTSSKEVRETWRLKRNVYTGTGSMAQALDELDADCVRAGLNCFPVHLGVYSITVEGSPSAINKVMSSPSWKRKVEKVANAKTAGAGTENARYLNSISPQEKSKILKHIADHYGVSVSEIEEEVTDRDAEKLFEYAASNNAMAMKIYRGMSRMASVSVDRPGRKIDVSKFTDMDGRPVKVNGLDDVIHVPSGFEGFPYEMSGSGSNLMILISDEDGEEKLVPALEVRKVRNLKKLRTFKDRYRNTGKVGDKVVLTPKGGSGLRKLLVGVVEMIFTEGNDPEVMIKMEGRPTDYPAEMLTMYDKYVEFYGEPKKASKTAASGNYGFTKAVQNDVEVALRKLQKKVDQLARAVESRHPEAGTYFRTRCQGSKCNASKALGGACLLNQIPKRMGAGPLGFKPNCAKASHKAISDLILYSGEVAHSLHKKTRDHVPYLQTHSKKKRCPLTRLLLENYPVEIL